MKKTMSVIVGFIALIVLGSAAARSEYAPVDGYRAPALTVGPSASFVSSPVSIDRFSSSLSDREGHYVLLNFWTASDADSRLRNADYDRFLADNNLNQDSIELLSVNFDRSERLFREIVRRDRLNEASQFHVEGPNATQIFSDYALDLGLRSFLIDRSGRIVATNPTVADLTKILSDRS